MMKFSKILAHRFHSMILAGMRFPLTVLFLAALAVSNIMSVQGSLDCSREIYAFAFGALLCAAAQMLYERIAGPQWRRLALLAAGAVLTGVYYLVVRMLPSIGTEASIRTASWLFAAVIAFIWLPSAFGAERFTDCFTTFFKSFFVSAFYSGVLFGGVSLILAAVDTLLFGIDTRCYGYTAVVIFWFLAPVLLLSMIPRFNSPEDTVAAMKGAQVPKFLETLLSYVLIPIAAVYTLVLLIYIVKSLGDILQNNLLDPLIISYSAAVLVLYLLACGVKNRFASVFRLVMPKVLAVIVLFELVCAFLNMLIGGVTLPRYFILLYGVYAVAAALVLSFASPRRTGAVAAMAIAFALFSTVPPVDAFTVSRVSQTVVLQSTLELNGM
ncbi:MAG: DUF4153 domain-containing protein, partial [Clostridia bacterium]|nr:DUF4153 domain-containing protein [Clostridia bacterium]